MADYDQLTKDELQDILRDRDLPVSGNKDELLVRLNEADADREAVKEASAHVDVADQVAEAQADAAQADADAEEDDKSPELTVFEHLQEQDREARAADPTVGALALVEAQAEKEAAEAQGAELDESVAALLNAGERSPDKPQTLEEAQALSDEVGGRADAQQALLLHNAEVEDEHVLAQRPVAQVDMLEDGAGAGTFRDTSHAGQDPGTVIREQRRPGAPLTEDQAAIATFPSGPKDREVPEEEQVFVPEEGEGPFTAVQADVEQEDA